MRNDHQTFMGTKNPFYIGTENLAYTVYFATSTIAGLIILVAYSVHRNS